MTSIPPHERPTAQQLAAGRSGNANTGIVCPRCGCSDLRRNNKQPLRATEIRYAYCRNCGHGVVTREAIIRDVVPQKKKDDNISPGESEPLQVYRETA